ncbi:amidohydrolase [Georgenia sp. MJ173]|uniref:amidohydrolase n=1 Tax=Georgenia sunbinii TaxID=3117728 RepID=UPI002F26ACE5
MSRSEPAAGAAAELIDPRDPVAVRRHVHARPELGFCEIRTADLVWRTVERLGWSVTGGTALTDAVGYVGLAPVDELDQACVEARAAGVDAVSVDRLSGGHTALVAELMGSRPGLTVGIRVDLDALPIHESGAREHHPARAGFASAVPGRMHACGHDGHVAVGLDLAARLAADRDFPGRVRLLFQPAEEGVRGAALLAAAGACDDLDTMLAFHLGFGLRPGEVAEARDLLATTKLRATFTGRPAHAANAPQEGRHALLAAAAATVSLHGLPRFAGISTRVNVGSLRADGAPNIVPAQARLEAEVRAGDQQSHAELERRARLVLQGAAVMHEVGLDIVVTGAATAATNDERLVRAVLAGAAAAGLTAVGPRSLGASDDASVLMSATQRRGGDAAYLLLGSGTYGPHHSATFDLDESVLPAAARLLELAIRSGRR